MGIDYRQGDATQPVGDGNKVIVHICNDIGGWGKGFVVALSNRWKAPEESYRKWFDTSHKNDFGLGCVNVAQVEDDTWVVNMLAQRGVEPDRYNRPPIRYEAVKLALAQAAIFCKEKNATMHMPRIGCGLAGGTWDKIEPHIQNEVIANGVDVVVYDFK
jgi:O-acetyl-ADP-ribose deacetylase (regulator of RNase III)